MSTSLKIPIKKQNASLSSYFASFTNKIGPPCLINCFRKISLRY